MPEGKIALIKGAGWEAGQGGGLNGWNRLHQQLIS